MNKALEINHLKKSFGDLEVLKDISLNAEKGDVICIIGSSGSGKSTLLRCINLLDIPDSGEVWVNGELINMSKNKAGNYYPQDQNQVDRIRPNLQWFFKVLTFGLI